MKGFVYPGVSPLKGKAEELMRASQRADSATEKWKSAMDQDVRGTDLIKMNNPKYGNVPGPIQKRAPIKNLNQEAYNQDVNLNQSNTTSFGDANAAAPKKSFGESFKSAMGTKIGTAVGEAVATGVVNLAIGALGNKKEKPANRTSSVSGFSNMKIGRS
tara:strand:- start:268 stop:744 length:477 start_codon:yes stop_codon:yes gene_type:complete